MTYFSSAYHFHNGYYYYYPKHDIKLYIERLPYMFLIVIIFLIINFPLFFRPKLLSEVKEKHGEPKEYLFLLKSCGRIVIPNIPLVIAFYDDYIVLKQVFSKKEYIFNKRDINTKIHKGLFVNAIEFSDKFQKLQVFTENKEQTGIILQNLKTK